MDHWGTKRSALGEQFSFISILIEAEEKLSHFRRGL
jgi:hypothetical protein